LYRRDRDQLGFFDAVYDVTVPQNHLVRKLEKTIDWSAFEPIFEDLYSEKGRHAHNPILMFKALVLQFLFDLSDRKLEEHLIGFMPFRWFLNLDPMGQPPDHTAYCRFRDRLGPDRTAELFGEVVRQARKLKLVKDRLSIVDATAIKAKVDTYRMNREKDDDDDGPPSRVDPEASYGHKTKKKPFFGYKAAVSFDAGSAVVTRVTATTGRAHDSTHFREVCEPKASGVLADKGYDSLMNFVFLALRGQRAGIIPKALRGRKKGHIQNRYPGAKDYLWFCRHKGKRSLVERFFAETKQWHGLGQARYWGLDKTKVQVIMTALAYNLKRIVKLCPEPA
jgi:IS5 family transposase